jgi:siroheme synthase-like protein
VAPVVTDEIAARADAEELRVQLRPFEEADLDGADLVLAAIDDHAESARISELARARRIPVHVADEPALCDFYFAATERRGPVQIAVSTGGAGPALAGRLRSRLVAALPDGVGEAVQRFGWLRGAVRVALPADAQSGRRMRWLTSFARTATWEELRSLDDDRIASLAKQAQAEIEH